MSRLAKEDLLHIAQQLHHQFHRRVYYHISSKHIVEREALRFSHIHRYVRHDGVYDIPVYTFNNKIYIHTDILDPLGHGHTVGEPSPSGSYYFPREA